MSFNYTAINDNDFSNAMSMMDYLIGQDQQQIQSKEQDAAPPLPSIQFPDHGKQSRIQTALNILNKAGEEGDRPLKNILRGKVIAQKIKALNALLKDHGKFKARVLQLGFAEKDADCVKGYQIAQPQTKFERFLEIASIIPRIAIILFSTVLTLVFAGIVALPLDQCCDLNPKPRVAHVVDAGAQKEEKAAAAAPYHGFEVSGVICFNSPLRGTPALDLVCKKATMDQRYKEMSADNEWRDQLYRDSLQAERDGELTVYTYGSTMDPACYDNCHRLTENPTRNQTVGTEGHHDTMISPRAMLFLRRAVQEIDPTGQIPVIGLHGSGAGKYQFTLFRTASGTQRTFTVDYAESRFGNSPEASIADYAKNDKIQNLFRQVYEATGQKKAILFGHSMGGLVALQIHRNIRQYKQESGARSQ